jgi:hypothetical protein
MKKGTKRAQKGQQKGCKKGNCEQPYWWSWMPSVPIMLEGRVSRRICPILFVVIPLEEAVELAAVWKGAQRPLNSVGSTPSLRKDFG